MSPRMLCVGNRPPAAVISKNGRGDTTTAGMFGEDRREDNLLERGGWEGRGGGQPCPGLRGGMDAYLDVGALQVAVGHPALEVGAHLLGGAVAGGGSQARFLAAPQAAGSPQHRTEERQITAGSGTRRF